METLGLAASTIAVLDLSAKVASLCFQYSKRVNNAKSDIERLGGELDRINIAVKGTQQLLQSPNGSQLQTSQQLRTGLDGCSSQLTKLQTELERKLGVGGSRKLMSRFGLRALRWPFESKDVDEIVKTLAQYRDTLSAALTVDQTVQILDIRQTLVLSKLPIAKDAAFDSHADEHNAQCHPETRVALRQEIIRWAEDLQGECIFWLNGMAGTGKSTISRTVAQSFNARGHLGASFFFKRGERDRGNSARLFTTIAADLVTRVPALAAHVQSAIDSNPAITGKALKEQFEKLILQPLGKLQGVPDKRIVLVIDALDECERDDDIRVIIYLLSQAKTLTSVRLRAFLTSRPELPIRLGFSNIRGKYQDVVLHEIPKPIIEHDISVFLDYQLAKIRHDYNSLCDAKHQLPPHWPGHRDVRDLVEMAVPLFIFAATICRFIGDQLWFDPAGQLEKVLQYQLGTQQSEIDKLDATYRPVLDQLVVRQTEAAKRALVKEFRSVVGSIILLVEPLPTSSLARLLDISISVIDRRLVSLHSVLSVPASEESPVRMFHLSFRDFLVDPEKRNTNPFWIDERATHEMIAAKCLELLSSSGHLRKDICGLGAPGTTYADIQPGVIESSLPTHIRYACLYWVYHLEQSSTPITDCHQAYAFLKRHFLHWLEALSLLGRISQSIAMIDSLQALMTAGNNVDVSAFLDDATRFILNYRSIIEIAPLQLYYSAIIFTPESSIIRNIFEDCISGWTSRLPKVNLDWGSCVQTLEGHNLSVMAVAFSPDGITLASASRDQTVRLWNVTTGEEKLKLRGDSQRVGAIAFSPDGMLLALPLSSQTIWLWNMKTSSIERKLECYSDSVRAITFSPDGAILALALYDQTIQLWDVKTGEQSGRHQGRGKTAYGVAFSPDGVTLTSESKYGTIQLWDIKTGKKRGLEGSWDEFTAAIFSPDGTMLALASYDRTIRLWYTKAGEEIQKLEGHSDGISALAFSPDGITLASASEDHTVKLWNTRLRKKKQINKTYPPINAITFSPDGITVASGSNDEFVRLWDVQSGEEKQILKGHERHVLAVAFSLDGTTLASASEDKTIRLWDAKTGEMKHILKGHKDEVHTIVFSPDSRVVASASRDQTIWLWDVKLGKENHVLNVQAYVNTIAFSLDGITLISISWGKIYLWDANTGKERQKIENQYFMASVTFFSLEGTTLALAFDDQSVCLWDVETGEKTSQTSQVLTFRPVSSDTRYADPYRTPLNFYLHTIEMSQHAKYQTTQCYISNHWVVRDGRRVLWLPPDFRPRCAARRDNTLALGCSSGLVTFIQFTE